MADSQRFLLLSLLQLLAMLSLFAAETLPSQVHIALAGRDSMGNPSGMAISWQTTTQTATSTVQYGTVSEKFVVN
jgi:hypothetical protein